MKWRPISELSDEQKDGRWWLFGSQNKPLENAYYENCRYCSKIKRWVNESLDDCYQGEDDKDGIPTHDFFLSEPLPNLPKPMKMEWRRFDEEAPEESQDILVCEAKTGTIFRVKFCDGLTNYKTHWKWMPIIPPEGE